MRITMLLMAVLLLFSVTCRAEDLEYSGTSTALYLNMTTYTPVCSISILGNDGKEAHIDFCGDKVKFSGDLPVDEAAQLFFEHVFGHFQSNNQLLRELKDCQDRSMRILGINADCISSLEKCANYLQGKKP